ncbi:DMT family transporter [Chryseolinea lacunae]|uniref:DMT family transporter n=1 Tax=Chryseolinea lacunae TaxID=2801331 RepID=A0ABS1L139_9BACT|nr:DMT family transporter [Chryseolinea lacunae]MBL0745295.1 DMT family transporter [Chryseolinea lacunae]
MLKKTWLIYALITTLFWGIWGALIELPEKVGFPATLGYSVWALTMIPCSLVALYLIRWKLEHDGRSIFLGSAIGLLGAGGQLILFQALREGPAYIVFPLISLFPILTIFLSMTLLKERASRKHWMGIVVSLVAILLLSYQPASGQGTSTYTWLILSVIVFVLWGLQAYVMKFSNETMKAESIFFYMMITAVLLIPVALLMTDFSKPVNWGFKGPYLAALIHVLNAVGALTLVYALRYGKAIIVVPMTGLSPLITVVLSLVLYGVVPGTVLSMGMVLAMIGIYLLSD